jgi:hypothetical protein
LSKIYPENSGKYSKRREQSWPIWFFSNHRKVDQHREKSGPEHRGTTMCEGNMYSAIKSSGSGTLTGTSRIMHLQ